ncbi:MAG: hypothetical protein AB8G86_05965 [Saprospiraceae bacterium]
MKASLTFWDKIYRIVPQNYSRRDSDEIKIAISNGFIEDIELSSEDLKQTAYAFEEFCNKLDFYPDGFDSRESHFSVRLHSEKIDDNLKPFFKQFEDSIDKEGFYILPKEIANGYMFFLSDTISKRRNIGKLTDSPDLFTAMSYFDVNGNIDEYVVNTEANETYTTLILENLIPKDIQSIKMEKIIELSQKLKNVKESYRTEVSSFSKLLSQVEDTNFAITQIEVFKAKLMENKYTRTEILKNLTSTLIPSALFVGIPVLTKPIIDSVFSDPNNLYDPVRIGTSLMLAGMASISDSGKAIRSQWNSKKSNYYLRIQNELDSEEKSIITVPNMMGKMNQYIND